MEITNVTVKVIQLTEPVHGWRYHSGTTIYTERFRDGRLIAASLQDTGVPYYTEDEETSTPAFDLVVDGESLSFGWDLVEASISAAGTGTPNTDTPNTGAHSTRLLLRHTLKPVELEIVTLAGGDGFFRRRTAPHQHLAHRHAGADRGGAAEPARLWPMSDNLRENLHDSRRRAVPGRLDAGHRMGQRGQLPVAGRPAERRAGLRLAARPQRAYDAVRRGAQQRLWRLPSWSAWPGRPTGA